MSYEEYKEEICEALCGMLEITPSAAKVIADEREEIIAHSYSRDLLPEEAAELVYEGMINDE